MEPGAPENFDFGLLLPTTTRVGDFTFLGLSGKIKSVILSFCLNQER